MHSELSNADKQERERQQQLRENMEQEIEKRADALAEKKIKAMFGNVPRGRAQRLEEYCDTIQLKDGRTILEAFEDKEKEMLRRGRSRGYER